MKSSQTGLGRRVGTVRIVRGLGFGVVAACIACGGSSPPAQTGGSDPGTSSLSDPTPAPAAEPPPSADNAAPPAHAPPLHVPEQQSKPTAHIAPLPPQADPGTVTTTPPELASSTKPGPGVPGVPGEPGAPGSNPCAPSGPPSVARSPALLLPPQFQVAKPPTPMNTTATALLHARFRSTMPSPDAATGPPATVFF